MLFIDYGVKWFRCEMIQHIQMFPSLQLSVSVSYACSCILAYVHSNFISKYTMYIMLLLIFIELNVSSECV
jgi:hypothetical protein